MKKGVWKKKIRKMGQQRDRYIESKIQNNIIMRKSYRVYNPEITKQWSKVAHAKKIRKVKLLLMR